MAKPKPLHIYLFAFLAFLAAPYVTTLAYVGGMTLRCGKEDYKAIVDNLRNHTDIADPMLSNDAKNVKQLGGWKPFFIDIHGLFQKGMEKQKDYEIYRLGNGFLTHIEPDQKEFIDSVAENFRTLKGRLDERGIPLLYVQYPGKILKGSSLLPAGGEPDYSNDNADYLLATLKKLGIDTLDLRDTAQNQNLDYYSLFFRTDHHWRPEAGLWASREIAKWANAAYGIGLELAKLEADQYESEEFKDCFLGSQGRRTGIYYSGVDGISAVFPRFDTDYEIRYSTGKARNLNSIRGQFNETLLHKEFMKKFYRSLSAYQDGYVGANFFVHQCINLNSGNEVKVLLLRDSFSLVVTPFLANACRELTSLDIRKRDRDKGFSLLDYIDEEKPDIVIVGTCPASITQDQGDWRSHAFNFQ